MLATTRTLLSETDFGKSGQTSQFQPLWASMEALLRAIERRRWLAPAIWGCLLLLAAVAAVTLSAYRAGQERAVNHFSVYIPQWDQHSRGGSAEQPLSRRAPSGSLVHWPTGAHAPRSP